MYKGIALFGLALLLAGCGAKSGPSLTLDSGLTDKLSRSPKTMSFWIDKVADQKFPFANGASSVRVPLAGTVTVMGWAIDDGNTSPAAGVDIVLDGKAYSTQYGLPRQDVADAKGAAYLKSGFQVSFPGTGLGKGPHTVSIRIIAADRSSYSSSPDWSLVVD